MAVNDLEGVYNECVNLLIDGKINLSDSGNAHKVITEKLEGTDYNFRDIEKLGELGLGSRLHSIFCNAAKSYKLNCVL